ncbi:hypothetical protein HH800_13695 [Sphingobium yanoikuyae]|jgi:phytoene synthase|uniref:Phytoene synthase n=1 Tax=Sphingobium yanoikuyae TaxID=13690 RepID=A0A6M4G7M4_SPHYA|nr:hypothetical protein [Sphingobium yanoikuyae]QJR03131.1 hypothetical protein HH800_13695 [Sphingobium yanoikuyae]
MMDRTDDLAPLARLLSGHAGRFAERHRALWALDQRFAQIARTTSDAAIGQMRLAWWLGVVTDEAGVKGQGEPVVDWLRAIGALDAPGIPAMLDGWEVLVVEPEIDLTGLRDYAAGRGGGLFQALADVADAPDWLIAAGKVWALWDLSAHSGDEALADAAIGLARDLLPQVGDPVWPKAWKPLRIAYLLARHDVERGQRAPVGLTRNMAWRLMRIALVGR